MGERKPMSIRLTVAWVCLVSAGWGVAGCASVSPGKREQVQRVQQTGVYSYQRIQRVNDAQAVSRRRQVRE